jgi:hypothetical protein
MVQRVRPDHEVRYQVLPRPEFAPAVRASQILMRAAFRADDRLPPLARVFSPRVAGREKSRYLRGQKAYPRICEELSESLYRSEVRSKLRIDNFTDDEPTAILSHGQGC